jgi:hypothetical protein
MAVTSSSLGQVNPPGAAISLAYCAQLCFDRELPLAGVESSGECYCGAAIAAGATRCTSSTQKGCDGMCSAACSGNASEHCGGNWEMGIYKFKCSGEPVPPPQPVTPPPAPSPPPGPQLPSSDLWLNPCAINDPTMHWNFSTALGSAGAIRVSDAAPMCMDCGACTAGTTLHTHQCGAPVPPAQAFIAVLDAGGVRANSSLRFHSVKNDKMCLGAVGIVRETQSKDSIGIPDRNMTTNLHIQMVVCDPDDTSQLFEQMPGGLLSPMQPPPMHTQRHCVAAMAVGCDDQRRASAIWPQLLRPYCNLSLTLEERVDALVGSMALGDKLENLGTGASMDASTLGVSGPRFNEALHGVNANCGAPTHFAEFDGNNTGCPSSFPHGTAMGSTYNRSLWSLVGRALSDEVRGFHAQNLAPLDMWSPTDVNMARDGRWGRAQEVRFCVPPERVYLIHATLMETVTLYCRYYADDLY